MTTLTETFHVVKLKNGDTFCLIRRDALNAWNTFTDKDEDENLQLYIAEEFVCEGWGFDVGCGMYEQLRAAGLRNLELYSVKTAKQSTEFQVEFISVVRAIFEAVLGFKDREKIEVPTVKVW